MGMSANVGLCPSSTRPSPTQVDDYWVSVSYDWEQLFNGPASHTLGSSDAFFLLHTTETVPGLALVIWAVVVNCLCYNFTPTYGILSDKCLS